MQTFCDWKDSSKWKIVSKPTPVTPFCFVELREKSHNRWVIMKHNRRMNKYQNLCLLETQARLINISRSLLLATFRLSQIYLTHMLPCMLSCHMLPCMQTEVAVHASHWLPFYIFLVSDVDIGVCIKKWELVRLRKKTLRLTWTTSLLLSKE